MRWLGLLGAGAAWAFHLGASYFLVAIGCARAWPALGILLALVTVAAVAGAGLAGGLGGRGVRAEPRGAPGEPDPGEAARFVAGVSLGLAGLFTFMILLQGVAALVLSPCGGA